MHIFTDEIHSQFFEGGKNEETRREIGRVSAFLFNLRLREGMGFALMSYFSTFVRMPT